MIFPLPLNPFEESLFCDDRPAYPWNGLVRLNFTGRVDREAMRTAVAATVARHPLVNANIKPGRRPVWVPALQPPGEIEWVVPRPDNGYPSMNWIDVTRDYPVRFWVAEGADRTEVVIHFNHMCLDGLGTMQIAGDLMLSYAAAVGGDPAGVKMPPLDESLLPYRGRYGLTTGRLLKWLPKLSVGVVGAKQFLMRKPLQLVPHEILPDDAPLGPEYPAVLSHAFTKAESAALFAAAKREGATVNDVLARELFITMGQWRQNRGLTEDGWLRLLVPMSLRTEDDRLMPAANIMTTIFLDRMVSALGDRAALLRSLNEEMSLIKRNHLGLIFVLSLRICRLLPGGIAAQVRRQPGIATAILTNVNRPLDGLMLPKVGGKLQAGDLVLDRVEVVPAIRPSTCLAVGVMSYAGRLSVAMHVDRRILDAAQAAELRELYVAAIRGYNVSAA